MAEKDNTEVPTFDIDSSYKVDIDSNKAAKIFPQSFEDAFNVSKEEKKDLWEDIKDDYKDDGFFDKYFNLLKPLERGERYQKEEKILQQEALDNKTNHISNVVGAPVENVGMTNLKDMSLVFDISRSKLFKNRKKKFLQSFEEGEYHSIPINVGDGKTETYEIFKYNKSDKKYKILNPDGRNISEMAAIAGMFLDEQLVGDALLLTGPKYLKKIGAIPHPAAKVVGTVGKTLDKIPPTTRVMMGNWLGLKARKLNEWVRGFGENEFEMAETLEEVDSNKFLFDLNDLGMSALSGVMYKTISEATGYLVKGQTPGMVNLSEDIIRAAKKLDLDPLIFAQLSTNPIIRRMYMQAGLFTDSPNALKVAQINKLKESLNKFGIGKGDGQLDMGQVHKLHEDLSISVGNKIKMFNKNFGTQKAQQMSLDEAINTWNKTNTKLRNAKTRKVFSNAEHLEDANINIDSFKRMFKKRMRDFVTDTEKLVQGKNTVNVAGDVIKKVIKKKGTVGKLDDVFNEIDQALKQMTTAGKVSKSNLPVNVLSQLNDPKFKNLETLFNLRDKLFTLTSSTDTKVSGAAVDLHNQLKLLLDPQNKFLQGSPELLSKVNILNAHMDGAENIKFLGFVKDAMGKATDPDAFVKQFLKPGNALKITQLKNMLTEGAGTEIEKKAAESAFNVLRKTWTTDILNVDDGINQLNKWISQDLDGLKLFLGDGWQEKVVDMKNIIGLQQKLLNGPLKKALIGGTEKEVTDKIIEEAAKKGIANHGKYFDDIINDYGGFDSNGVEMVRFHIIKGILDRAKKPVEKGSQMFKDTLDPTMLKNGIRELQANPYLIRFFDDGVERLLIANTDEIAKKYNVNIGDEIRLPPPMIEALQNYNLYATALGGQSDVGGMIAAGELANKTTQGMFNPKVLLETGLSILKHNIVAKMLSKKTSSSLFNKLNVDDAISKENLQIINESISVVAKELIGTSQGYNKMEDNGIIHSFTDDDIDTSLRNTGTGSGSMMLPTDNKNLILPNNIKTSFNTDRPISQSSVANANMFGPVNQDTMTKGKQLFKDDITFAAQGGIMNTKTAFQRVA